MSRLAPVARQELGPLCIRRSIGLAVARLVPELAGSRLRSAVLRLAGLPIGSDSIVAGRLRVLGGPSTNLRIGPNCFLNAHVHIDITAPVTLGDGVSIAQHVLILTNSHRVGASDHRAGALEAKPITIGDGAWVGARSILLPGVTIGAGSIVAAGAVVSRDVEANSMVAGVPARAIRRLDP